MRYTIKFLYNNKCYYQHWSDLINAPISYLLSGKRWELYYSNLYGEKAFTEWFQNNRKSLDLKSALKSYNNTHRVNYPPLIEVGASWSISATRQVYPGSKGYPNLEYYQNYIANFSRFLLAFRSLSCLELHSGHVHSLSARFFTSLFL